MALVEVSGLHFRLYKRGHDYNSGIGWGTLWDLRSIYHYNKSLPVIGQLVAASTVAAAPAAGGVVVATVTQLMMTAAVLSYGAYLGEGLLQRDRIKAPPVPLNVEGIDVTDYPIFRHPQVEAAIQFGREAHRGQTRKTGEPYFTHCLHTARILAALVPAEGQRAIDTVVAGLLHDVVDDTGKTLSDVREEFGHRVAELVEGVSRLSTINQLLRRHRRTSAEQNATDTGLSASEVDCLRCMLLGMVNDPRVVLIKLADRLHNMRTIHALPHAKATAVAQETLAVWCSLALRLGVWAVKAELEDLCFAVLEPKTFRHLRAELASMWTPPDNWRSLQKNRRSKRWREEAVEGWKKEEDGEEEEVSMKDLLSAVLPFDVLSDKSRRIPAVGSAPAMTSKPKVVRDAEVALAALGACEEALEKELLISTSYVPGMEVTLSGRLKSLYSMHCKMRRKKVSLEQVFDARALRVVVGDGAGACAAGAVEGCYHLLSLVHRLWTPVGGELDDYILNPKPSGYQSLHTAVRGPDGAALEVQIRTQGMHEYAEYGHAAHWLYKEGDTPPPHSPCPLTGGASEGTMDDRSKGRAVCIGAPALRIEEGRLLAAVVVGVEEGGARLLVAVSFALHAREAVAAGRGGSQVQRWATYARLLQKVQEQWWNSPGHGDWTVCLERYRLCRDGIYHKEDQFGRHLTTFMQLLDLSTEESAEYAEVGEKVRGGAEIQEGDEGIRERGMEERQIATRPSVAARLNNKVRLLRDMLQWEQELRHEASEDGREGDLVLAEVLVIRWPSGEILRMPHGSAASDAAIMEGAPGRVVCINGRAAMPQTKLRDGDLVEVRV